MDKNNMDKNTYNRELIDEYKHLVTSLINERKDKAHDPLLTIEEIEEGLTNRICTLDEFCKKVFVNRHEIVSQRKVTIGASRTPQNFVEEEVPASLNIGPVSNITFRHIEILGGSQKIRGYALRDPLTESFTWDRINYANPTLPAILPKDVIPFLTKKNLFYKRLPKKDHYGKYVFLGGTTNHAHCIWEFVMRMALIDKLFKDNNVKLAVSSDAKNLVEKWFDQLGYSKEKIYYFDGDRANYFEEITFVTCLFGSYGDDYCIHPESFFDIRNRALKNIRTFATHRNKVYITRLDANHRKMRNESEFIDYLSKNGFEILTLSELTLSEQIDAVANASVVISPIGAGSAMAMFAPSDALVIEIAERNLYGGYNGVISALLLNQAFYRVITNQSETYSKAEDLRGDFVGNLETVKKILKKNEIQIL